MMEPYISGSEEEVRRREVYMYYGLLVKVAELKLFTSELKLVLGVFWFTNQATPTWWSHLVAACCNKALSPKPWCHSAKWPWPTGQHPHVYWQRSLTWDWIRLALPDIKGKWFPESKKTLDKKNKSKIWPETHILCTFSVLLGATRFKEKRTYVLLITVGLVDFLFRWNRIWVVVSNIVVSTLLLEMIQFDEHIFQMGWFNHQLEPHWLGTIRNVSEVWIFFVLSYQLLVGFSAPRRRTWEMGP